MSMSKIVNIQCPACKKDGEFEVWESVNVTLQPELRNRLLTHDLFTYVCPHCKQQLVVAYSCLYHDMDRKFMVYLINKKDEKENLLKFEDEKMKKILEEYRVRIVPGVSTLVEKIGIFEAELDDQAIELCKAFLHTQFTEAKPNNPLLAIYFGGINEEKNGLEFYFISEKEDPCLTVFPRDLYDGVVDDLKKSKFYNPHELEVDTEWAKKALLGQVFSSNNSSPDLGKNSNNDKK